MRRYSYRSGGKSDGYGCVIFLVMLFFLPALGWIFNILNWVMEHISWIIFGVVAIWFISLVVNSSLKESEEEETDI